MKTTTLVQEVEPLVGTISQETIEELSLFFINTSLDSSERTQLVDIILSEFK
jgi:hypothetical protein